VIVKGLLDQLNRFSTKFIGVLLRVRGELKRFPIRLHGIKDFLVGVLLNGFVSNFLKGFYVIVGL
jgi:hypothetical protein